MKEGDSVFLIRDNRLVKAKIFSVLASFSYAWVELENGQKLLVETASLQEANEGSQKEIVSYIHPSRKKGS